MGIEKQKLDWFAVDVGGVKFDVSADCSDCAVTTLEEYLDEPVGWPIATAALRGALLGVPSINDGAPVTVRELDDSATQRTRPEIAMDMGGQAVLYRGV